jgi:hypothetical protein
MKRLGLRGGMKARGPRGLDPGDLPALDTPEAAARWLDVVARAVATGRLGYREGVAIVRALDVFLKAHDHGVVSQEVAELRAALAEWKKSGDARSLLEVVR